MGHLKPLEYSMLVLTMLNHPTSLWPKDKRRPLQNGRECVSPQCPVAHKKMPPDTHVEDLYIHKVFSFLITSPQRHWLLSYQRSSLPWVSALVTNKNTAGIWVQGRTGPQQAGNTLCCVVLSTQYSWTPQTLGPSLS